MWRRCAALLCGVVALRRCCAALLCGVAVRLAAALLLAAALGGVVRSGAVRLAAARCCSLLRWVALCAVVNRAKGNNEEVRKSQTRGTVHQRGPLYSALTP